MHILDEINQAIQEAAEDVGEEEMFKVFEDYRKTFIGSGEDVVLPQEE